MYKNKNSRFRKGRLRGQATSQLQLRGFNYGFKVLETGYLTPEQIEAARKSIKFALKKSRRNHLFFIRVSPLLAQSKKKSGIRMGGSKGGFHSFIYRARRGMLLFELKNIIGYQVLRKLNRLRKKLPIKTVCVKRLSF